MIIGLHTDNDGEAESPAELVFPPKHLVVPVDGSDNALSALKAAVELAKTFDAELSIITITPRDRNAVRLASGYPGDQSIVQQYYEEMDRQSERLMKNSADIARKMGLASVKTETIPAFDSVPKQILDYAEKNNADLIVMGTRGLGGFKRLVLGSVSSAIVANAQCSVLVVR